MVYKELVSYLNTKCWLKIIAKALAMRLKEALPKLISFQQTTYVKKGSPRLISDILEMKENLNFEGYVVTVDIEKASEFLNHSFLLVIFKNMDMNMTL